MANKDNSTEELEKQGIRKGLVKEDTVDVHSGSITQSVAPQSGLKTILYYILFLGVGIGIGWFLKPATKSIVETQFLPGKVVQDSTLLARIDELNLSNRHLQNELQELRSMQFSDIPSEDLPNNDSITIADLDGEEVITLEDNSKGIVYGDKGEELFEYDFRSTAYLLYDQGWTTHDIGHKALPALKELYEAANKFPDTLKSVEYIDKPVDFWEEPVVAYSTGAIIGAIIVKALIGGSK